MAVEVRLMGPVTLLRDGEPVDAGGPKQRTILGVLDTRAPLVAARAGPRCGEAGDTEEARRIIDVLAHEHPKPARRTEVVGRLVLDLRLAALAGRVPHHATKIARLSPFSTDGPLQHLVLSLDDLHETGADHRVLAPVHRDLVAGAHYGGLPECAYVEGWVAELEDPPAARRRYESALEGATGDRACDFTGPAFAAAVHIALARLDERAGDVDATIDHLADAIALLANWPGPRRERAIAARSRLTGERTATSANSDNVEGEIPPTAL